MKKGFTLIELLVVVLIIGILAAIAVPQYQKAVEKSRAAETKLWAKTLADAQALYSANTGTLASCLNDLDIDLSTFSYDENTCSEIATKGTGNNQIMLWVDGERSMVFRGDHGISGKGGFSSSFIFGGKGAPRENGMYCIEYGCHAVEEGSFCRKIMGYKTLVSEDWCIRWFKE